MKLIIRAIKTTTLPLLLLAGFAVSPSALAQGNCPDIEFSSQMTSQFPNIADSCLEIVTRNGEQFARLEAEIVRTTGNTVRARFQHPDGSYSDTYTIDMPADARVTIDGRQYRYRDLSRGQKVSVYLPSDRWAFNIPEGDDFATESVATVAVVTPMRVSESTAMLPSTASPLPLIGILGGLFSALGFALVAVRRRFS